MKIKSILVSGKAMVAAGIVSMMVFTGCEKNLDDPTIINGDSSSSDVAAQAQNHVPNELLVKFKSGTSETARAAAFARISGKVKEHILTKAMQRVGDEGVYLVRTPLAAFEAIAKAQGLEVEYAEPNFIYQHQATTIEDSYFKSGQLWGMYSSQAPNGTTDPINRYGSQANTAWAAGKTGSEDVIIGIIDEGVQNSHPDLNTNIWTNPFDLPDGADNDGNGLIDDVNGWDFDGNNNSIYDGTSDDHGTHVAGTIGAVGGNGLGVAGVTWKVKMISAKFLGASGGTTANAVKAVEYFTNLKTRAINPINIVATNNSWGGGGYSQALYDAIERANNAGILFVAAAGNGGQDGRGDDLDSKRGASYPASYTNANIISVAALTSSGSRSTFSNYGVKSVDLGAPGSGIYSTLPNGYGSYSGTSMATPHVTGAVALYASTHPGATASAIKEAILSAAKSTPTSSISGNTVTGGRLNVSGF